MATNSLEYITDKDITAFWKKVEKSSEPGGCWLWAGYENSYGYGVFSRKRVNEPRINFLTHRLSYILVNGELPADKPIVRHKCDVRLCCNPDHLESGDAADNARDIVVRGRHWTKTNPEKISRGKDHWAKLHPELVPKGEGHGGSKLTETQVSEIRDRYRSEKISQRSLASEYGVCQGTVWQIVNNNYWKTEVDNQQAKD